MYFMLQPSTAKTQRGNIKKDFNGEERTLDGINKMNRIFFFSRHSEKNK